MQSYRAPRWLPGGNLQTIWPALHARRHGLRPPAYRRERWHTPDGDFVDADWLDTETADEPGLARRRLASQRPAVPDARATPLLALFHGLEGSSASHYAIAFGDAARRRGWRFVVPHFRGCSGELNLAPRAYHSGDHVEIGWLLAQCRARHAGPIVAVGISLGGNVLMRWAAEAGDDAARSVRALAAVSSPLDLAAGGHAIGCGFNRLVYARMFLRSMKPKALAKLRQHPGLFDRAKMLAAHDLYEFDDVFTAPLHGFRDVLDYWTRASAKPHLHRIRVPALLVNAANDPFVPRASLPRPHEVGAAVTLWQPRHGGHVGFAGGRFPGHVRLLPDAVGDWLDTHL